MTHNRIDSQTTPVRRTFLRPANRFLGSAVRLALASLALVAAGCGETSYFEVSLVVKPDPGVSCISMGNVCTVSVTGADSDYFSLNEGACRTRSNTNLGMFQYATEKESGSVTFKVSLLTGNNKELAVGTASGNIKKGGRQPLTVDLVPDEAALAEAKCK